MNPGAKIKPVVGSVSLRSSVVLSPCGLPESSTFNFKKMSRQLAQHQVLMNCITVTANLAKTTQIIDSSFRNGKQTDHNGGLHSIPPQEAGWEVQAPELNVRRLVCLTQPDSSNRGPHSGENFALYSHVILRTDYDTCARRPVGCSPSLTFPH